MTHRGLAGPSLFAPAERDASDWLASVIAWRSCAQRLPLRFVAAPHFWQRVADMAGSPIHDSVRASLSRDGLAASTPAAYQVLAALQGLTDTLEWDGVVIDWDASGCLSSDVEQGVAAEILAAGRLLGAVDVWVAGGALRDEEEASLSGIEGVAADPFTTNLRVSCHRVPNTFIASLDPVDSVDDPRLAVEIACLQIATGAPITSSRFEVLPQFAPTLAAMDRGLQRTTIQTMAHLLLPASDRPRGLDEHPIRTGRGPADPPLRGRRGMAKRIDITQHGTGWRLHLWRGEDGVTFSNVAPHNSMEIYE